MAQTKKRTPAKKRGAQKGITLVSTTQNPILPVPLVFGDPSRELAWQRLWDELYSDLLTLVMQADQESLAA